MGLQLLNTIIYDNWINESLIAGIFWALVVAAAMANNLWSTNVQESQMSIMEIAWCKIPLMLRFVIFNSSHNIIMA